IPGWQHIGDEAWQDVAVQNVKDMVRQYRNHTSIILWGVRINESVDDDAFYRRTNKAAHILDPTRPTGGVRCYKKSHLYEDVYTYNDFVHSGDNQGCDKKSAVTSDMGKAYLISEYMGHMFPTKAFDWEEHRLEDAIRHANVLNEVAKQEDIAGSFGWCMFDYNTHKDFGSGDRICYHGVMDMFRNEKLAAYVYAEMQDELPVLELSSSMDIGEHPGCNRNETYIFTNADSVRMYKNDHLIKEYRHEAKQFPYLKNPPIRIDDYIGDLLEKGENMPEAQAQDVKEILNEVAKFGLYKMSKSTYLKALKLMTVYHMKMDDAVALYNKYIGDWGGAATTYRFEAIKDGKVVKELRKAPMTEVHLDILVDHTTLRETHTYDVACLRFRAVDENGNLLNYYNDPLVLQMTGAAKLIGPAVTGLSGGMGGAYVRTVGEGGKAELRVTDGAGNLLGCVEFCTEILGEA
ncbi:MAG: glycoside hydrolase family 2 protein, partial [Lachnospiraceae bacterium]|nr:glycoside hydrolase family 2 protein [Lachnospiraceae bacterium]